MIQNAVEPTLSKGSINWGDSFRMAYVQSKRYFQDIQRREDSDEGLVTYKAVADRVSQLVPVSETTILRLKTIDDIQSDRVHPGTRQIAYLSLVAMGYDPLEFGLNPTDRALRGLSEVEVRKLLDPGQLVSHA